MSNPLFTGTKDRIDGVPALNLLILPDGTYSLLKSNGLMWPNHPLTGLLNFSKISLETYKNDGEPGPPFKNLKVNNS